MQKTGARKALLISLLIGVGGIVGGLFPTATFAADISSVTTQVLPQGANTCAQLPVTNFVPYVYSNELNSFDFTIPDTSYVAIIGQVGNISVPFNQFTRSSSAGGLLKIHADIASTKVNGTLPISVTLLSSKGQGQAVCLSIVTTSVQSSVAVTPTPSSGGTTGGTTSGGTSNSGSTSATKPTPSKPATTTKPPVKSSTSTATGTPATPVVGSTSNVLKNACDSSSSADRLWFVLLALYAVTAAVAALGVPHNGAQTWRKEWLAGVIVVPFVLLFGVWYFLESCRSGVWAPAVAIIIALAGLAGVYWSQRSHISVIALPQSQPPKPSATPVKPSPVANTAVKPAVVATTSTPAMQQGKKA